MAARLLIPARSRQRLNSCPNLTDRVIDLPELFRCLVHSHRWHIRVCCGTAIMAAESVVINRIDDPPVNQPPSNLVGTQRPRGLPYITVQNRSRRIIKRVSHRGSPASTPEPWARSAIARSQCHYIWRRLRCRHRSTGACICPMPGTTAMLQPTRGRQRQRLAGDPRHS